MRKKLFILLTILAFAQSCLSEDKERQDMFAHTNALIHETSPYLLQHAHNPVDWHPWGEEAFKKAVAENKPIFLSIGYSACHWCHVMEKESFEDEQTAKLMNDLFINIKVDREERPDVDQVYMAFVQMFTGSGGWPMSVFLTPDKKPFYGGTYFPPQDSYGRPGFKKLLSMVSDYYHNNPKDLNRTLAQVERSFQDMNSEPEADSIPDRNSMLLAAEQISRNYDADYGGFGGAPKFPSAQVLAFLLRVYKETGHKQYLEMVEFTLKNMGRGGIYDQLGGGFARYSVDARWLVPHFEKMLYDNAQLAEIYLDVYLITNNSFYLEILEKTLDFVCREMLSPEGGFYSSMDADSEGEEGKYYLWTKSEIEKILEPQAAQIFCAYYDVSRPGNFEGRNILHIVSSPKQLAEKYNLSEGQVLEILKKSGKQLLARRKKRIAPAIDKKVILSWNGLMLSAFARAYQVLPKEEYGRIIRRNISLIQNKLYDGRRLLRSYKDRRARYNANLEDYANLIRGLLDAYEALFENQYLEWAAGLTDRVIEDFWDLRSGGYYYTSTIQEILIRRMKSGSDQSLPSGAGTMLLNQLRLYAYSAKAVYLEKSETLMALYGKQMLYSPQGFASFLNGLHFYLYPADEIVIVSHEEKPNLLRVVRNGFLPNKIIVHISNRKSASSLINPALMVDRPMINKKPTAYVCKNAQCSLPVTGVAQLQAILFNK